MTIDERLDRLTERHEALAQTMELIAAAQIKNDERFGQVARNFEIVPILSSGSSTSRPPMSSASKTSKTEATEVTWRQETPPSHDHRRNASTGSPSATKR